MSSPISEIFSRLAVPARWRAQLERVAEIARSVPEGGVANPALLARRLGLSVAQVIALMGALQAQGRGQLAFRVVQNGVEFSPKRYMNRHQIPDVVENEFGDEMRVLPENVELVFDPHPAPREG